MSITNQEAEHLDALFAESLQNYNDKRTQEAAMRVKEAWDLLLGIMLRENNLSDHLGNELTDWQIGNWANDTSEVLHNAKLYPEEIRVNEQILRIQWDNSQLFHENAKRDIADAYADMGEFGKSCQLFQEYLKADPLWGWGWIGYYRVLHDHGDPRHEEVLEDLYLRIMAGEIFRDKEDLYRELGDEYNDLGNSERAAYFYEMQEAEKRRRNQNRFTFQENKSVPLVKPKKIYPNDPCPCGSGKKYKQCHGR